MMKKENMRITQIVEDNMLFELLRKLRKEVADGENVPPYIIFSDVTLREMSALLPKNEAELMQIKGVGERKLEAYGPTFLKAINQYCEEQGIARTEMSFPIGQAPKKQSERASNKEPSHHITHRLLEEGLSIAEIATERGVTERTIEGHLLKCPDDGLEVDWSRFVPTEFEPSIQKAVEQAGLERLTPIKELLPEEISFFMIRAYLEKQKA